MNSVEFCKKPTYSEKSARLKFGVFQQNRPIAVIGATENLRDQMNLLAFDGYAAMLNSNSGQKEANPCHYLTNSDVAMSLR